MTRRLLLSYLSITAFVLMVLEVPLGLVFVHSEHRNLVSEVRQDALVLTLQAEKALLGDGSASSNMARLQQLAEGYHRQIGGRVVVVNATGEVLVDSQPRRTSHNFRNRPEVSKALKGEIADGWRHSWTLRDELLYVAAPVASGDRVVGAVRVTYPASAMSKRIRRMVLGLMAVALVVLVVVGAVSLQLAHSVTRPLLELEAAASRLGRGDLATRARADIGPPEVRVLARELNDTADRLARLLEAQRGFVADASHQLRTPLAALRLHLENLEVDLRGDAHDDVAAALAEVGRLSRLLDGLLTLARAEQQGPARQAVELAPIVEGRRAVWSALAEERGVALVSQVDHDLRVLATPGKLEQILDNLLANALEVSPRGTSVELRAEMTDGRLEVHVVDQGPGMTEEERNRAFGRFWQGNSDRRPTGTSGLGLAIVRRLVVSDGGEVELRADSKGGLDATIRLRAAPPGSSSPSSEAGPRPATPGPGGYPSVGVPQPGASADGLAGGTLALSQGKWGDSDDAATGSGRGS